MSKPEYKEPIIVRKNLDFGLNADDIPNYWMAGDAYKTRVMDSVQSSFPDGERYFISTVRAFRDQIEDPALRHEVKDFMSQEGQHGIVHTDFNARLQRQGIAIDKFTANAKAVSDKRLQRYSPGYNVALTAALEHFTAMMADLFFAEKTMLAGADHRVRAMFAWHAVEEMEHKAVAFDVMQKVAKVGYFKRILAMTHATLSFTLFTLIAPWFMLGMDGHSTSTRLKMYAKNLGWLLGPRKGIFGRMLPMILKYYQPGFHPNHIPSVHNYPDWANSYSKEQDPIAAGEEMYAAAH
ncbi:MAG: metal-dependent hydrolase [Spongiibacteraceae bacterium]